MVFAFQEKDARIVPVVDAAALSKSCRFAQK
jgi:hypothetical protein